MKPLTKSRKISYICCLHLFLLWGIVLSAQAAASEYPEICVYLDFPDKSSFIRVLSPDESLPAGHLGEPGSFEDMKLLKNGNAVFYLQSVDKDYQFKPGNITRQVFDGSVSQSNWGLKSMEHQDTRGKLFGESESGRLIFRPLGASHGCGPGVNIGLDLPNPFPLGCSLYQGKKWYIIPNGSWYQSWDKLPSSGLFEQSYKIYRDRLEVKNYSWWYKTWDNEKGIGKRIIHIASLEQEKLTRNSLNACLGSCGNVNLSSSFEDIPPSASFYCLDSENTPEHYVFSRIPKRNRFVLSGENGKAIIPPKEDFSENEIGGKRLLWLVKNSDETYQSFVLSSRLFQKWVGQFNLDVASVKEINSDSEYRIFGYDRSRGKLVSFCWKKDIDGKETVKDFREISTGSGIEDFRVSEDLSVYLIRLKVFPESLIDYLDDGLRDKGKGRIVFEQKCVLEILTVQPDFSIAKSIATYQIGNKYLSRAFTIQPEKYSQIFRNGKNPASHSINLHEWIAPVPEYPDTFRQPLKVIMDIREK
ncbi:MAG: hypothetical protein HQM10_13660 [Candidatus Riflebacteria bacterium]|nr:hypothetical protein [Candidatus Riflebacteria bacterium]